MTIRGSAEWKAKISAKLMGHSVSDEARQKMGTAQKERPRCPHTLETRRKISVAKMGHLVSPETRAKISETSKGRLHSVDAKHSIADATKKSWQNSETRARRIAGLRNIPRSPETRAKQHLIMKARYSDKVSRQRLSEKTKRQFADPEAKRKWIERIREVRAASQHRTEPERVFEDICKQLNLPFTYTGNGAFWVEDINPDFVDSNGHKVAVDIFGDYWHTPLFRRKALRPKFTEAIRKETMKKYGWRLVIFWESELKLPDAKERIIKKLGATYGRG